MKSAHWEYQEQRIEIMSIPTNKSFQLCKLLMFQNQIFKARKNLKKKRKLSFDESVDILSEKKEYKIRMR